MLSSKQLKALRKQVVLNSLFLNDYKNDLYIKPETACNFFNSYLDNLYDLAISNGFNNLGVFDVIALYDNLKNLKAFYSEYPIYQNDFIATKCINNFDSLVIYDIDTNSIIPTIKVAYLVNNGCGFATNTEIKEYRLYESVKRGYYFMLKNRRYYIDEFIKTNY